MAKNQPPWPAGPENCNPFVGKGVVHRCLRTTHWPCNKKTRQKKKLWQFLSHVSQHTVVCCCSRRYTRPKWFAPWCFDLIFKFSVVWGLALLSFAQCPPSPLFVLHLQFSWNNFFPVLDFQKFFLRGCGMLEIFAVSTGVHLSSSFL